MTAKQYEKIRKIISEKSDEFKSLAKSIHENPELGLEEHEAVKSQVALLESLGFKVTTPFSSLSTAYKAVWGDGGPCFMFIAEYDALPGLGHACGHNLIAPCSIAAAWAVKNILESENIPGTVMVVGTPAEEGIGGKLIMIRERAFMRVDAAMMAHPADFTSPDLGSLSVYRYVVTFRGESAHASASPEQGRNALDAVNLLFAGISAWRQYLPESSRVHGIIRDGGCMPNIIPDHAECRFYLRGENESITAEMEKRFKDIVKGAAMMSATKYRIHEEGNAYRATLLNGPLNDTFFEMAQTAGLNPVKPTRGGRASTDFGNLSQVLPGAHVYFQIADTGTAWHSVEFAKAAVTDKAMDQMLKTAAAMSLAAYKFYTDKTFRDMVKSDFQKKSKAK